MSTDSHGRPLSDDAQWAWNGTAWVPAGGAETRQVSGDSGGAGATTIAPSPLAGSGAQSGGQQGYGSAPPGSPGGAPAYGGPPGYGSAPAGGAPGYGGVPGYGGAASPQRSRTPLILMIVGGLVVIAAIVVVLIIALGGSKKSRLSGLYRCTVDGRASSATITFNSGNTYTASGRGNGGTYTYDKANDRLTFNGGALDKTTGTYDPSGTKGVNFLFKGHNLFCTKP